MKIDMSKARPVLTPTEEITTIAPGEYLPADFNKPYFSSMVHDFGEDQEAMTALSIAAHAKFGSQPTHRKNEHGGWERTPAYQQARAEHSAAIRALRTKAISPRVAATEN